MPIFDEPNGPDDVEIRQVRRSAIVHLVEARGAGMRPQPVPPLDEFGTDAVEIRRVQRLRPLESHGAEMPNARPSSEFNSVLEEAQNRLYQVYNGPVGEVVPPILQLRVKLLVT